MEEPSIACPLIAQRLEINRKTVRKYLRQQDFSPTPPFSHARPVRRAPRGRVEKAPRYHPWGFFLLRAIRQIPLQHYGAEVPATGTGHGRDHCNPSLNRRCTSGGRPTPIRSSTRRGGVGQFGHKLPD